MTLEGSRYSLLVCPDPGVSVLGQLVCIPLTSDDVVDDRQAGLAGDVADDVLQLHVHLAEGLLHVLNMVGGIADQHGALPQETPKTPDFPLRAEGCRQQSIGV